MLFEGMQRSPIILNCTYGADCDVATSAADSVTKQDPFSEVETVPHAHLPILHWVFGNRSKVVGPNLSLTFRLFN